jgi:hypothetical protein
MGEKTEDNAHMPRNPPHIRHAREAVAYLTLSTAQRRSLPVVCTTPLSSRRSAWTRAVIQISGDRKIR